MMDELGDTLMDKENMKVDLSGADASVIPFLFIITETNAIKVSRIKASKRLINDSFILGHPSNAILGTSMLGDRRSAPETLFDITP